MDDNFDLVRKEAIRLLRENDKLKHYEALMQTNLNIKEKELSDGGLKSSIVKQNIL